MLPEQRVQGPWRQTCLILGALTCAVLLFVLFTTFASLKQQMILGWIFVLGLFIFKRVSVLSADLQRVLVILLTLVLTSRYWWFRSTETIFYTGLWDSLGMSLLYMAELYAVMILLLGMFVNAFPLRRQLKTVAPDRDDLPSVDIYIPTYNEPSGIVASTVSAAAQIFYPPSKLNIYILDDGGTVQKRNDSDPALAQSARQRHEVLKSLARELNNQYAPGVHYLTREKNQAAKAGNISEALLCTCTEETVGMLTRSACLEMGAKASQGEIILILDCDHAPTRDILINTVGWFMEDEEIFLVQTPHFFVNPDPVERNLGTFEQSPAENEMFYGVVHLGLDFWNSSFFCGSAALLRRSHLDSNGGIAGQTITEDAETALGLHAKGLKSVYVNKPMVCGLSPETFSDFITQRSRWAQGMTQIFLLKNPLFQKGLSWYQRLCYTNNCMFWLFGMARAIFFIAPLMYLLFGLKVYNASLAQVLAYTLPHVFGAVMLSDFLYGHVRHPFFSELYEAVQSFFNVPALLSTLMRPKSPSFHVTPKIQDMTEDRLSPLAGPFYPLLFLSLAAYPGAIHRFITHPAELDTILICLFWATFNLMLVLLCLGVVWEKHQYRRKHRLPTKEAGALQVKDQEHPLIPVTVENISEDGLGLVLAESHMFSPGQTCLLHVTDSYGMDYVLPCEVVRTEKAGPGRLRLGCRFVIQDVPAKAAVIGYVFGDSSRWERFWMERRKSRVGVLLGSWRLFFLGLKGTIRHLYGLLGLLIHSVLRRWARAGGRSAPAHAELNSGERPDSMSNPDIQRSRSLRWYGNR